MIETVSSESCPKNHRQVQSQVYLNERIKRSNVRSTGHTLKVLCILESTGVDISMLVDACLQTLTRASQVCVIVMNPLFRKVLT